MKPDGGSAFPRVYSQQSDIARTPGWRTESAGGMTLRDYFAAKALHSALQAEREARMGRINPGEFNYEGVAEAAYLVADAMLAERAK